MTENCKLSTTSVMTIPKIGTKAPGFDAPVLGAAYEEGERVTLAGLRGKRVVLVFYPKDSTPG